MSATSSLAGSLQTLATPLLYRRNAFRVAGLTIDVTSRDLSRLRQRAAMSAKLGMPPPRDERALLAMKPPPDAEALRAAFEALLDPVQRFLHEFFWVWLVDERSKELAKAGSLRALASHWRTLEARSDPTGVVAHDLAVLYHAQALDMELRRGELPAATRKRVTKLWEETYRRWVRLCGHEEFWEVVGARVRLFDDPRLTQAEPRALRRALPTALLRPQALLALRAAETRDKAAVTRHRALLRHSGFDTAHVGKARREVVQPGLQRVGLMLDEVSARACRDAAGPHEAVWKFMNEINPLLGTLNLLLDENDATRTEVMDRVARTILSEVALFAREAGDWGPVVAVLTAIRRLPSSERLRQEVEKALKAAEENHKRTACFFCGRNPPDPEDAVSVHLWKDPQRVPSPNLRGPAGAWVAYDPRRNEPWWGGRPPSSSGSGQVHFRQVTVRVPRCWPCKQNHNLRASGRTKARRRIRAKSEARDYPAVKQLLDEGWRPGEEPTEMDLRQLGLIS